MRRLAVIAVVLSLHPTVAVAQTQDISGFWELPQDGRKVPRAVLVTAVTQAVLEEQAKQDAHTARWCNYIGMPALMDAGRPIDIRQGRREVAIQPEANATPRHIYLNRGHVPAEEFDPTTNGDSVGRWEGDTLVVTTVGFAADRGLTAIPGGGFRTATTRLTERFRMLDDGAVLSVTFTWEDPNVFVKPHTYEFRYRRLAAGYEPRPALVCDPFDEERTRFLSAAPAASSTR
jgi:hypothetical protein